jgi:hypothetical protein
MSDCAPGRSKHHFVVMAESKVFEGADVVRCLHCPKTKVRHRDGTDLKLVLGVVTDEGVEIR